MGRQEWKGRGKITVVENSHGVIVSLGTEFCFCVFWICLARGESGRLTVDVGYCYWFCRTGGLRGFEEE